jgi:hypothetical protein
MTSWNIERNPLIRNEGVRARLGKKLCKNKKKLCKNKAGRWTLNQPVQGSSPCAPTNKIVSRDYENTTAPGQRRGQQSETRLISWDEPNKYRER